MWNQREGWAPPMIIQGGGGCDQSGSLNTQVFSKVTVKIMNDE